MSDRPEDARASRPVIFGEVLYDVFPGGQEVLGGAPFNVAWHLQGFGLRPLLISAVGDDARGEAIRTTMRDWGLDTQGLQTAADAPTGTVEITREDGTHGFLIPDGQAYDFIGAEAAAAALSGVEPSLLYHGSLALRNPVSRAALIRLRDAVAQPVFLDVNLRDPWWEPETVGTLIDAATWLKLNDGELLALGASDPDDGGAPSTLMQGRRLVAMIVTRGEQGAMIVPASGEPLETGPSGTAVVDTVGAGDAFSAVCILGLLSGWQYMDILLRANEFAARVCETRGATPADPALYAGQMEAWQAARA